MYALFGQCLAAKLALLTESEGAFVRPGIHPPTDEVPLVSWLRNGWDQNRFHDERDGKQGVGKQATFQVQVVVWDTDSVRKDRVVDLIAGSTDAPGLLGLAEWMPTPDEPRIGVQQVVFADDPSDSAEKAEDGSEIWWYATTLAFSFTCVTE